jgi:hypothetical protein
MNYTLAEKAYYELSSQLEEVLATLEPAEQLEFLVATQGHVANLTGRAVNSLQVELAGEGSPLPGVLTLEPMTAPKNGKNTAVSQLVYWLNARGYTRWAQEVRTKVKPKHAKELLEMFTCPSALRRDQEARHEYELDVLSMLRHYLLNS